MGAGYNSVGASCGCAPGYGTRALAMSAEYGPAPRHATIGKALLVSVVTRQ